MKMTFFLLRMGQLSYTRVQGPLPSLPLGGGPTTAEYSIATRRKFVPLPSHYFLLRAPLEYDVLR